MTLDEINQNIGKLVFFRFAPDDLPDFDSVPHVGFGVILGIKEDPDLHYPVDLDISHYGLIDKNYEFKEKEILFIVQDQHAKIFRLIL